MTKKLQRKINIRSELCINSCPTNFIFLAFILLRHRSNPWSRDVEMMTRTQKTTYFQRRSFLFQRPVVLFVPSRQKVLLELIRFFSLREHLYSCYHAHETKVSKKRLIIKNHNQNASNQKSRKKHKFTFFSKLQHCRFNLHREFHRLIPFDTTRGDSCPHENKRHIGTRQNETLVGVQRRLRNIRSSTLVE